MVPAYAGVGSGGRLRKVPESSGVKWCRFGKQVPGRFRRVPVYAGVGSGGGFRKVPKLEGSGGLRRFLARVGVGSRGRVRKVPEGSEEFRRVLV